MSGDLARRLGGVPDLSLEAVEARKKGAGPNGAELITLARRNLEAANKLIGIGVRNKRTVNLLLSAATQVRLAEITPRDRAYLHVHPLERIQAVKDEVRAAAGDGTAHELGLLAADVIHRLDRLKIQGARL